MHRRSTRVRNTVLFSVAVAVLASLAWAIGYFRARVPPGCTDARTVALVHQSLVSRFHFPPATELANIRTLAGGWLAIRYACVATLTGFDPRDLPPGPLPGEVHFTSRLTAGRERHEVSVRIDPVLIWEKVE